MHGLVSYGSDTDDEADAEGPAPSTDPGTGVGSDDRLRHELVRQALVRQGYIDAAHLDLRTPEQLAEHQAAHGRQPTQAMQERIERFTALRSRGVFLNDRLVGTHSFRNPSIMSKLIEFLELDEAGTNLEPSVYDPRAFPKQAFYRELAKAQEEKPIGVAQPFPTNVAAAIEMAKERAKRFTHSIEESQALAAGSGGPDSAADAGTAGRKRKPRWDQ
nr:hypothetical protein HK105_001721 [Polyrhizophydium stewartii]